ncbi:hypothetical protein AALP_AA7G184200 [Arabis alpina]|uniref:Uncharacterized protein n=1 Tax=Arabis alpina TaxID=50452 RepID=A0A087GIX6_ARAAL|nr:hypothetical protein AALP_AA7G184200 [Arabis alpina]
MTKIKKKSSKNLSPSPSPSAPELAQPPSLVSPILLEEPTPVIPLSVTAMPPAACDSFSQVPQDSHATAKPHAALASLIPTPSGSIRPTKPLAVDATPPTEPLSSAGTKGSLVSEADKQAPGASPSPPNLAMKVTWSELVQGTSTKMKKRGTPFVLDSGLTPAMPSLEEVPVWLEFKGVPPHFYSEEGLEYVASILGDPQYCHQTTLNMTNLEVAKVLTIINLSQPIPEALNVQFENGERARVELFCPWLSPICSFCSQVGHNIRRCPTGPITCQACNSSSHSPEGCPRALKPDPKSASSSSVPPLKDPPKALEKEAINQTYKKNKKKNTIRREVGRRNSPLIINDPSEVLPETITAEMKVQREKLLSLAKVDKGKGKASSPAPSIENSDADSDSVSDSSQEAISSSSEDHSGPEFSAFEKLEHGRKLSKKQRRFAKKLAGNRPKSHPSN